MTKTIFKYLSTLITLSVFYAFIKGLFVGDVVDVKFIQRITIVLIISLIGTIGTIGCYLKDDD